MDVFFDNGNGHTVPSCTLDEELGGIKQHDYLRLIAVHFEYSIVSTELAGSCGRQRLGRGIVVD